MKKVVLSLALVAVVSLVSCKKTEEAPAEGTVDTTVVETPAEPVAPVTADTVAVDTVKTTTTKTETAPAQ
jgi:hypothetical protein